MQRPMTHMNILIGDDQPDILEALRLLLKAAGHTTHPVDSPTALLRAAKATDFDLILMDLNYARDTTSGQEGLDLLKRLQAEDNTAPVIVMTAWGNIDLAVEAMRRGASDFIQKPWDNAKLLETIEKLSRIRHQSELDLARHVQRKLFPRVPLELPGVECAALCIPASDVSGDYYDFFPMNDRTAAFLLADVSGKGMAAALLMANLQASFRGLPHHQPLTLLATVNRLFHQSTAQEHYATLFYGNYDDNSGKLSYINCGHLPAIVLRAGGTIERLEPTATVIGLFPFWKGEQQQVHLNPEDTLLVFSDGVTEAGIDTDNELGDDGLISLLERFRHEAPERILERLAAEIQHRQTDDLTLLLLRLRQPEHVATVLSSPTAALHR